jgi:hypothetical protein
MTATAPISIRTEILQRAERNARTLGLSVSEYLSRLVVQDSPATRVVTSARSPDPWGPVPQEVSDRWEREIAEFEEENQKKHTLVLLPDVRW